METDRKIKAAFDLFDKDKGVVDVREIGTIIRSLGVNPSEADLRILIDEVSDEESPGFIRWEKFRRMAQRILTEETNKYARDSEDKLVRAFRVLDPEGKGFIDPEELRNMLTTKGEKFSQVEMDEFLSFAIEEQSGVIYYEDYAVATAKEGDIFS
mmetsp:Transcript_50086/g.83131  ORF Transcript_50086/g.83131 Transcript_50086/m.83131 type:complete len:155 (+) Transcript_50086:64-528(+)|eukprot:CAMPEP_0184336498 /NCGR_PEP_ID=MMETSP1089-20130417/4773_1 /TAXON_ID=38269 ORGANISM="Gloeochaete wittrockiana, Strain SAG46.84" /NCGR_SAMPLE_ID=MMETSP1089 /ASSEMBLY_ACC=CAM_ASM_000445 /LENGTH=154 /DNA_ID=CAMNT_0026661535 /DNA_START=51 /DNA_END=515 /DNA_ORIENTATION=-